MKCVSCKHYPKTGHKESLGSIVAAFRSSKRFLFPWPVEGEQKKQNREVEVCSHKPNMQGNFSPSPIAKCHKLQTILYC